MEHVVITASVMDNSPKVIELTDTTDTDSNNNNNKINTNIDSIDTNNINSNQLDKINNNSNNNLSANKNLKKTETTVIDERKTIKKNNKNFVNNNSNNKIIKNNNINSSNNNLDGIISPIENPSEEITANQIANKLYTNPVNKQLTTSMNSNSATAIVNISSNHQQQQQPYINPMANHSVKNAYPILKQGSKDDLISNNIRNDSKSPMAAEKRNDTNSPTAVAILPAKQSQDTMDTKKNLPKSKAICVDSRIVFLKIGQIDTRNERYDAEAYIECSWHDDEMFKLLTNSTDQRYHGVGSNQSNVAALKNVLKNISAFEYDPNQHWSPQLYIENAIGDLKEEVRHKIEIVEKVHTNNHMKVTPENISKHMSNFTVRVCEMRKLRGVFYEVFQFNSFNFTS